MKRGFLIGTLALSLASGCHSAKTPNYAAIRAHARKAEAALPDGSSQPASAAPNTPNQNSSLSLSSASVNDPELSRAKITGQNTKMRCTWVKTQGIAEVTNSMSPAQARALAISDARRIALKKVLGVRIRSRDLVFQQSGLQGQDSLIQSLVQTMRQGRILSEKVGKNDYVPSSSCPYCQYQATVSDCVKPLLHRSDRSFWVRVSLDTQHLTNGESDQIHVFASTDCYVYLYYQGMDGSLSLIAPNDYVSTLEVSPNHSLLYPDPQDAREDGLELVAEIPNGQKMSAETISVIASKEPLPDVLYHLRKNEDYFSLLKKLNASPYDWTDDAQPYFIYAH